LLQLLSETKNFDPDLPNPNPKVRDYYDAVSRAASDKGRRVRREEILAELVSEIEGV
jgi:hypothetical protein